VINLLPPQLKEDIHFAKQNAWLIGYVKVLIAVGVVLVGIFVGTHIYLQKQLTSVNAQVGEKQSTISQYSKVEKQAAAANERLEAIKQVSDQRTHFAELLDAISSVLPKGVILQQLSLTGDVTHPVAIDYQANSYQTAIAMRDALLLSPKIQAADITGINKDPNKPIYTGHVVIAFAPGATK
jgi:Tfp pilus assembly protein PilN